MQRVSRLMKKVVTSFLGAIYEFQYNHRLIFVGLCLLPFIAIYGLMQMGRNVVYSSGPSLVTYRSGHADVRLKDGSVLITGGGFSNFFSGMEKEGRSQCYCFLPESGTWLQVGSMNRPRREHTSTLLEDGRVLVVGGNPDNTCELYDPTSRTWKLTAPMPAPRIQHSAILLADGRVLVSGGMSADRNNALTLKDCELFEPTSETWSRAADLPKPFLGLSSLRLNNGQVLVVGGGTYDGPNSFAQIYDPKTNTWKIGGQFDLKLFPKQEIPDADPRTSKPYFTANNSIAFQLFAGATLMKAEYHINTDSWSLVPDENSPLDQLLSNKGVYSFQATETLLRDGRTLIVGGDTASYCGGNGAYCIKEGDGAGNLAPVYVYDPVKNQLDMQGTFPWSYPQSKVKLSVNSVPTSDSTPAIHLESTPLSESEGLSVTLAFDKGAVMATVKNMGNHALRILSRLRYKDSGGVYAIERGEEDFQLYYATTLFGHVWGWEPLNSYTPLLLPDMTKMLQPGQTEICPYNPDSYRVVSGIRRSATPFANSYPPVYDYSVLIANFHNDRPNIAPYLRACVQVQAETGTRSVWSNSITLTSQELSDWKNTVPQVDEARN